MDRLKNDFYQWIKTSNHFFDFMLEVCPKGLLYCDLTATGGVWISEEWKKDLGYPQTTESLNIDDIIIREDLDRLILGLDDGDFDPLVEYPIGFKYHSGSVLPTICTGMVDKDLEGNPSKLLIAVKRVQNKEALLCQLIGPANEIVTDLTHLNERIKLSEERFRRAFEHAAIGMAIVSLKGKWLRINSSMFNILGYHPSELLRLTFQDITHPEDLGKDLNLLNEVINGTRDSYQMEKRYFHKKGHIVWVILAVSIVKNSEGQPIHFISQLTDISKVKAAEYEIKSVLDLTSEQNRRLLNFAHIVSHNLRSHSGNISMLLNFIETDVDEQSRQELFSMFRHAASNLQETIGHLNEVVAVNTSISENLIGIQLSKAINGAVGNVEALLKAANALCVNDVNNDVMIDAIPAYLDSILLNFLTNAIKYRSTERRLVITLQAKPEESHVLLSISDNGIGIDLQANRDKIFGMYKTFHTNEDARGIGLFITKNQIEAIGGKVSVESEPGKGTTFNIQFKINKPQASKP